MSSIHHLQMKEKTLRLSSGLSKANWKQLMQLIRVQAALIADRKLTRSSLALEFRYWAERFWARSHCPGVTDPDAIEHILHEALVNAVFRVQLDREHRPTRSCATFENRRARKTAKRRVEVAARKSYTELRPADGFINGDWKMMSIAGYVNIVLTLGLTTNIKLFTYSDMVNNVAWEIHNRFSGCGKVVGLTLYYEGCEFNLVGDEAEVEWRAYRTVVPRDLMVHYCRARVDGREGEYPGDGKWCA